MTDAIQAPVALGGGGSQATSMFSRLSRASASPDWLAPFAPAGEARTSVASVAAPAPVDLSAGLPSVDFASPVGNSAAINSSSNAASSRNRFLNLFSRAAAAAPQPPMALDSLVTIDDVGEPGQKAPVKVTISPFTRPQTAHASNTSKAVALDGTWGALSGLNGAPVAAPTFKLFSQPKAPRTIDATAHAAVEPPKALWNELPAPTLDAFSRHHAPSTVQERQEFSYEHRLRPPQAVTVSPLRAESPSPVLAPATVAPLVPPSVHALQPIGEDSPMTAPLPAPAAPMKTASKLPATIAATTSLAAPSPLAQLWPQEWWTSLRNAGSSSPVAAQAPTVSEFSRSVAPPSTVEDRKLQELEAKKENYLQTLFAPEEPLLSVASMSNRATTVKQANATSAILAEFDEEDRKADDIYQAVSIVLEAVRHADTPTSPSPLF